MNRRRRVAVTLLGTVLVLHGLLLGIKALASADARFFAPGA